MSEKLSNMYKLDRTIGLVTNASPITQNLALLDIDEYLMADSLAVIHAGYINYIPIINSLRRCKYVSINTGRDRGSGCILNVKWMKLGRETFLIVLASDSLIVYDAEVTEALFRHSFKNEKQKDVIPVGSSVIQEYLCVGLCNGLVHLFSVSEGHEFEYIHRVKIDEFLICKGVAQYLVVASRQNIAMWKLSNCLFCHKQEINSEKLESIPAVLEVVPELAIVGYENGEIGVYSLDRQRTMVKSQAHRAKVTAVDYSPMKTMILSASLDHFIKVWQFNFTHLSMSSIFCLETNYEICGVGFLNLRCTEFCAVKSNNIKVDVFAKVEAEYE